MDKPTPGKSPSGSVTSATAKQKTMTFPEAIIKLMEGNKIHKLEWKNQEYYGLLKDTLVQLHKPDGKFYAWTINEGDLVGTDWIVI